MEFEPCSGGSRRDARDGVEPRHEDPVGQEVELEHGHGAQGHRQPSQQPQLEAQELVGGLNLRGRQARGGFQ